jgi:large subunit ribosomal protein L10
MDRTQKQTAIGELKQRFDRMTSLVLLDYKGINVETVTKLRAEFRKAGVEYRVAKNTLVKQALKGSKILDVLSPHLRGMTAFAWSYEDPSAAAKVVKNFLKEKENEGKIAVRGGLVDGQILDAKAVTDQLATMPGKDELRAMLLATMQAPLQQFVVQLAAPSQNFAYLLDAKHREMGGTSEG